MNAERPPIPILDKAPPAMLALADQAVVSGANFLHVLAAARCLSVSDFGVFSLALTVVQFGGNIHQALLLQPLAILYPEQPEGTVRRYIRWLSQFQIRIAAISLLLIAGTFLLPKWLPLVAAATALTICRQSAEYQRRIAYAAQDSARALLIDGFSYLPLILITGFFWLRPIEVSPALALSIATPFSALGTITGLFLLRFVGSSHTPGPPTKAYLQQHWELGRWNLIANLAMYSGSQLLPFFVASYIGLAATAALSAGRSLIGVCHIVLGGIEAYAVPRLRSAHASGDHGRFHAISTQTAVYLTALVVPVVLATTFFPKWLFRVAIDSRYQEYWWVLSSFGFLYLLNAAARFFSIRLSGIRELRAGALGYALTAILTLLAGPPLIKSTGLPGCIAILFANALLVITTQYIFLRSYNRRHPS